MKREMIVAYGKYDRAIGQDGFMPWGTTLTQDLRRFRQLTLGKSIIMGRHTFESIGRALPGRQNIVVTTRENLSDDVTVAHSLEDAYTRADSAPIVIGGGQLYREALPHTDIIFATEIEGRFPRADTFFPDLPPEPIFIEAPGARRRIRPDVLGGYAYEFTTYLQHLEETITYESFV